MAFQQMGKDSTVRRGPTVPVQTVALEARTALAMNTEAAAHGGDTWLMLAIDGIARASQLQLLQPFFTLAGAWWLLGESIDVVTIGIALLIIGTVVLSRRITSQRSEPAGPAPVSSEERNT